MSKHELLLMIEQMLIEAAKERVIDVTEIKMDEIACVILFIYLDHNGQEQTRTIAIGD